MSETHALVINQTDLIAKLEEAKTQSDGDLARVIELLLLENHVLALGQSAGLRRGVTMDFSRFPRFLQIEDVRQTDKEDG